ncbi:MAG: HlyD family secretion protein [Alphaproteobacteria bacterium]|nr:HlyD family secretion protein [Alphaproteobacteria bacterium]
MTGQGREQESVDGAAAARGAARQRRRLRRLLLAAGPFAVLAAAVSLYLAGGRYVSTDNAYVKADKVMIAAEVSGLIAEVVVREHQRVAAGELLLRIDDRAYRIALAEAEARLVAVRDEIEALRAAHGRKREELSLAGLELAHARREFERHAQLASANALPRARLDAIRHDLDMARQRLRVVEQEIAEIAAQLGGTPDAPVEAHPRHQAARAARERAALELERTAIRAPFAGIATNTPLPGQQVIGNGPMSRPIMAVVADQEPWIEANFRETDLAHVRTGQPARVTIDSHTGRVLQGRVRSIAPATGAEFAIIPPQNATGNWVKIVQRIPVRIALEPDEAAGLRAGMSAEVEIDTGRRRSLPEPLRVVLDWLGVGPVAEAAARK